MFYLFRVRSRFGQNSKTIITTDDEFLKCMFIDVCAFERKGRREGEKKRTREKGGERASKLLDSD